LRQPRQRNLRDDHYGSQFKFEGDHPLPEAYTAKISNAVR